MADIGHIEKWRRSVDRAVGGRLRFWGSAMTVGAGWLWGLLDGFARAGAVLALLIGVSVLSVLSHRPAWIIIGAGVAVLVVVFAEGTYRVEQASGVALAEQSNTVADRLGELADEGMLIRDEIPEGGAWGFRGADRFQEVIKHWQLRVEAEVRRNAREQLDYWLEDPDDRSMGGSPDDARAFVDFSVEQVREIARRVRG
jgi:hypothetical protein